MTSNIGSQYLLDGINDNGEISEEAEKMVMNDLRAHFRPEFLNRLDEIIMFKPLTKDNIGHINERLTGQEISLKLTEAGKNFVIEGGYEPMYGARPLKRFLQKNVETLAAREILSGEVRGGDTIVIDAQDGALVTRIEHGEEQA